VIRPLQKPSTSIKELDDIIAELDKALASGMTFTISMILSPWIGQYVGLGIFGFTFRENVTIGCLVIAIESRQ